MLTLLLLPPLDLLWWVVQTVVREDGFKCERAVRLRRDLVKRFIKEGSVYELHAAIPLDLRERVRTHHHLPPSPSPLSHHRPLAQLRRHRTA